MNPLKKIKKTFFAENFFNLADNVADKIIMDEF